MGATRSDARKHSYLDDPEAVATQVETVHSMADASISKVKRLFPLKGRSRVRIWHGLSVSTKPRDRDTKRESLPFR